MRQALAVVGRIGVLTVGASLWWMAGLWYAQGKYGLDVLQLQRDGEDRRRPGNRP